MTSEEHSGIVPFIVGAALGVTVVTAFIAQGWFDVDRLPIPVWASGVAIVASIAAVVYVSARQRSRLGLAVAAALVPLGVGTMAVRIAEPDPAWAQGLRASGLLVMLALALGGTLWRARRFKELDRLLFTEATSVAFFATIVASSGYAVFEAFVETPDVSFIWVPVFGLVSWVVAHVVFERSYA